MQRSADFMLVDRVRIGGTRAEKIAKLFDNGEGMSIRDMANRFGVSYSTIRNELLAVANVNTLPGEQKRDWRCAGTEFKKLVATVILVAVLSQSVAHMKFSQVNWFGDMINYIADRFEQAIST